MLWSGENVEVRVVQPYQARKSYICPGCGRDIKVGLGHIVAVPIGAPDFRRHWHKGCWKSREKRPPVADG